MYKTRGFPSQPHDWFGFFQTKFLTKIIIGVFIYLAYKLFFSSVFFFFSKIKPMLSIDINKKHIECF